ncbi:MAG: dipeptidase [Verrucomicrobia bacterium]|nr:dipeptidase [Verrucomicrobiota bacterium]
MIEDLFQFLRFPSISADSKYRPEVDACAGWLTDRLHKIGLEARKIPTAGQPVVLAKSRRDPAKRTVLIYGHYDVQPVDPLDLWKTPPFEPNVRDEKIFARGATDNKGQIMAHILGVEETLKEKRELPVNVIFLIEGEEEIGSPSLEEFLKTYANELTADIIAISDTSMIAPGTPTFAYATRGILCLEIRLRGPAADLHSGLFGGSVANPATVLSELIAQLHDADGRVAIPGFYDRVKPIESWERELWAALPYDDRRWLATTGAPALAGEAGFNTLERVWARPTAEVNGIGGGYQGEGPKTIIPSRAFAKLSFRLVPDQEPTELRTIITKYLTKLCPHSLELEVLYQEQGKPYLVNPDSKFGEKAQRALKRTFQKPIAFVREGGSLPIIQSFKDVLGLDSLLLGLALPDCNAHSPNENFPIENFAAGIRLNRNLLEEIGAAA